MIAGEVKDIGAAPANGSDQEEVLDAARNKIVNRIFYGGVKSRKGAAELNLMNVCFFLEKMY